VNPLPLDKKFLLLRLGNQLEPIVKRKEIKPFFTSIERNTFFKQKRAELRESGKTARNFDIIETWLSSWLKGDALLIDAEGNPYCRESEIPHETLTKQLYTYPIMHNERNLGTLSIKTNVKLPLEDHWPDLIDDVIHTIIIIQER